MQIQRMKLFHYPASRSARAKWMLHEVAGDEFDVERVDLYGAAQYSPEFLRLNPNHCVPVLEITWDTGDKQRVIESAAIVAFLADAFPDAGLGPPPAASPERADYLQMLHFGSTWMDMMLWQIRAHEHVLPEPQRDQRSIDRYRRKFRDEVEPQIATRLDQASYICGGSFTAADCVVGHSVFWARGYGMCRDEIFRSYISRLSRRPAFQSAFADAREFSPDATGNPLAHHFTG